MITGFADLPKNSDSIADQALKIPSDQSNLEEVGQWVRPASYTKPFGIQSVADIFGVIRSE